MEDLELRATTNERSDRVPKYRNNASDEDYVRFAPDDKPS